MPKGAGANIRGWHGHCRLRFAGLAPYTCTKDSHWKEAGAGTYCRPFPDKPYFRFGLDEIHRNKVLLIEKSRHDAFLALRWLFHSCSYHDRAARGPISVAEGRQGRRADRLCQDSLRATTAGSEATIPLGKAAQKPVQSEAGIC